MSTCTIIGCQAMGYNRKITIESKQMAGGFVCTVGALDMPTNLGGGGGELVAGLGFMLMFEFSLGFAVSATSLSDNYKVCYYPKA